MGAVAGGSAPGPPSALKGPRPQTPDGLSYTGLREKEPDGLSYTGLRQKEPDGLSYTGLRQKEPDRLGYADLRQKEPDGLDIASLRQKAPRRLDGVGPRPKGAARPRRMPAGPERHRADRVCRQASKRPAYFSPVSTGGSPDSTRFFSPANARSMMTFSALRLIMPSMGILTSTVRRYVTSVAPAPAGLSR